MSNQPPPFDLEQAHRHFAVACFNRTWEYLDRPQRVADDREAMVLCAMASLWHWMQRSDCAARHRSVGHWQVSRALAVAGRGEEAMHHARQSLVHAAGEGPFYVGYAHEAIARAARQLGQEAICADHLAEARACAAEVNEAAERKALEDDLAL